MADPLDKYNLGPFGLNPARTKGGALGQGILSGIESLGQFGNDLIELPSELGSGVMDYFMSPSAFSEDVSENLSKPEYRGIDLADIPGSGVGRPDFAQDVFDTLGSIEGLRIVDTFDKPSKPFPENFEELKRANKAEAFREKEADLAKNAGLNSDLNLQEISDLIASSQIGEALKAPAQKAEDFRAAEEDIATAQGMRVTDEVVDDAFISAMQDFNKSAGKDDTPAKGETREEALARYKKEFADATGIDASGKVDKSKALMAFGLALMQNKAGKGFNIGKMLQSVGSAGEAAQPMLDKAIDRANAAKLAAGKYALNQIKAGESAASALLKEQREFQRERYLKRLEHENAMELEELKAGGKPIDLKNVKVDKVINGLEVQRGRGPSGSAFVFPEDALRDSTGALKSVNGALNTVDVMIDLATQIGNEESPALSMIKESAQSALVGAGLADANVVFGETGVGKRQQIRVLQDSIITQFKRMLTQETGNGISKSDVDNIRTMLGQIDLLGNPQESIARLKEIQILFNGKRTAIRGVLDELQDPTQYPTQAEYEKNMELLPTLLTGNTQYSIKPSGNQNLIDVSD